jgi:aminoglycoside phosphotransferase (APT) family kinase protein
MMETGEAAREPSMVDTARYLQERLPSVVSGAIGETVEAVSDLTGLSGGASRDTWSFDARTTSGRLLPLILQRHRSVAIDSGLLVETEAELLGAALRGGVPVARLLGADATDRTLGAPFLLVERIEGETVPQRILRRPEYATARKRLPYQYGAALAQLQRVPLEAVPGLRVEDPLERYRLVLDEVASPHPALELGFRWLSQNRPPSRSQVLVHGDFRNGNGIVTEDGLAAIIDFELAHIGDPLEDIGWFCIRAWRFGASPQAGGYGSIAEFLEGYRRGGGCLVELKALHWWMVLGTVRWAVICLIQAATHLSGHRRSVELAAVGRRTCEPEFDLMLLLP